MREPVRYAWNATRGMVPSDVAFGPMRYVAESDYNALAAVLAASEAECKRYRAAIAENSEYEMEYDGRMLPMCIQCGANLGVDKHRADCITHDAARSGGEVA